MTRFISMVLLLGFVVGCSGIHNAVKHEWTDQVRKYVRQGDLESIQASDGFTPVMVAAYYDHYEIAEYLIDQGADVDAQDFDGRTALMYACAYNYYDMAKLLLDHRASVVIEDDFGKRASDYAEEASLSAIGTLLDQYPHNTAPAMTMDEKRRLQKKKWKKMKRQQKKNKKKKYKDI